MCLDLYVFILSSRFDYIYSEGVLDVFMNTVAVELEVSPIMRMNVDHKFSYSRVGGRTS